MRISDWSSDVCSSDLCATALRRFNELASKPDNAVVLGISADLPFAQARFCGAEGLERVVMLSTMRGHEFLENYGVAIAEGPLAGVAARAVVVVDENARVVHAQLVSEIGEEPDYAAAPAPLARARRSAAAQRHGRAARPRGP